MKNRSKYSGLTAVLAILVLVIVASILAKNWNQILIFPWQINFIYLFLVVVFQFISLAMTFWAWQLMVNRLGGYISLLTGIRLYYTSNLTRRLPTIFPQVGSRLVLYKQAGISRTSIMNCILLETVLTIISGILIFLIFLPFYSTVKHNLVIPMIITGVILLLAFLLKPELLVQLTNYFLARLKRSGLTQMPNRKDIIIWILIYMLAWFFGGISFYFLPRALAAIQGPGFFDALGITTLSTLFSILVLPLPFSFGVKEITGAALLIPWMPVSTAIIITIAYRIILTISDIFWALAASLIPSKHAHISTDSNDQIQQ